MKERTKTFSKHWFDDEILFIDELGIHLKPGVKRLQFPYIKPDDMEPHLNTIDLITTKIRRVNEQNRDEWDQNEVPEMERRSVY